MGHTLLGDAYGTGPEPDPSLEAAAVRVLARETTLTLTAADLHQVGAFGDADRDPRSGRTVSIAYLAVVGDDRDLARHPDDAIGHVSRVQFRPVVDLLARPSRLEFDHEDIVMAAIRLLRQLVLTTPLAAKFCRDQFTLGELR
ncbi:MAG: NUDIX hydrolase, partial [Acidimicrobiia bacterium]|nr:NUDIX hydrolase [Acidimicrobiia bacterium]